MLVNLETIIKEEPTRTEVHLAQLRVSLLYDLMFINNSEEEKYL